MTLSRQPARGFSSRSSFHPLSGSKNLPRLRERFPAETIVLDGWLRWGAHRLPLRYARQGGFSSPIGSGRRGPGPREQKSPHQMHHGFYRHLRPVSSIVKGGRRHEGIHCKSMYLHEKKRCAQSQGVTIGNRAGDYQAHRLALIQAHIRIAVKEQWGRCEGCPRLATPCELEDNDGNVYSGTQPGQTHSPNQGCADDPSQGTPAFSRGGVNRVYGSIWVHLFGSIQGAIQGYIEDWTFVDPDKRGRSRRNSFKSFKYGRHDWTRTSDLFRVKVSRLSKSTTYKTPMAI